MLLGFGAERVLADGVLEGSFWVREFFSWQSNAPSVQPAGDVPTGSNCVDY